MNRILVPLACVLLASCASPYRPPTAQEPHAVLKVRRVYDKKAGTRLVEKLTISAHEALSRVTAIAELPEAQADGVLVHPTPARFELSGSFVHDEYRMVQEQYFVQEPYTAYETYNCGSGTSYRSCGRSVTHHRSVPRYRMVNRLVPVVDGTCRASTWFSPEVGKTYLLNYTYQDHGVCQLSCFEQYKADTSGELQQTACRVLSAAEIEQAEQD